MGRPISIVAACAVMVALLATQASGGHVRLAMDAVAIEHVARVNVSTSGAEADGPTFGAVLAAGGRHVAFVSGGSTLVPGDTNGARDVFVRNLDASTTWRASVASGGRESNGRSEKPSLSGDGDVVTFPSSATNLVDVDANRLQDVFVHDRGTRTTERVSVGTGDEANGPSLASFVSGDGRVVVFSSSASNLVADDRNGALDVFALDRATGEISRVSAGAYGESVARSEASSVDAYGTVIGFRSYSANLVYGDWNGEADVFVHDRLTGFTERVNVSSAGVEAGKPTFRGMVSGDGRFVGFRSRAANLVPQDTNRALDVFVHDRATGETTRVSVGADGVEADADGLDSRVRRSLFMSRPFLSADGRFAAFTSRAPNLVPGDRNGDADVFVHDLLTGTTKRVSVSAAGDEANGASAVSGISADGRTVAYTSLADNLVAGDTNARRDVFVARLRLVG